MKTLKKTILYLFLAFAVISCSSDSDESITTTTSNEPNVYIAGFEGNTNLTAKIWKNGTATNLTNGMSNARAMDIFVNGSDVYATGEENNVVKVCVCSGHGIQW